MFCGFGSLRRTNRKDTEARDSFKENKITFFSDTSGKKTVFIVENDMGSLDIKGYCYT